MIQDVEVAFLGEADIPKQHAEPLTNEETVPGPSGIKTSAVSGAVQPPPGASTSPTNPQPSVTTTTSGPNTQLPRQQPSSSKNTFPDVDITKLMELGVSREEAINALELAGGNVDIAAGLLL